MKQLENGLLIAETWLDLQDLWNWMAIGQHHGLPARFLYWTFTERIMYPGLNGISRWLTRWCSEKSTEHHRTLGHKKRG